MKKSVSFDSLNNDIKADNIKRCYIFNGEEEYLKALYLKKIYETFCKGSIKELSYFEYDGKKGLDLKSVVDNGDAPPMFGANKLFVIRNLNLFSSENSQGSAGDAKIFTDYIKSIPDYLCIVFYNSTDSKFTKNSKLYKEIKKCYNDEVFIEFSYMSPEYLTAWIKNFFKGKKTIAPDAVQYLIEIKDGKMNDILMEANKLLNYSSQMDSILKSDVEKLCSKSVEYEIFVLTDMIGQKNVKEALNILNNMKSKKVAAPYIISMLNWQFKNLLMVSSMANNGVKSSEIVSNLNMKEYTVTKTMKLIRNFSEKLLLNALRDCAECDLNIKRSSVDPFLALETIIVKYGSKY